mgnify:CR=1 FL=1
MTVGEFSSPLLKGPDGKFVPGAGQIDLSPLSLSGTTVSSLPSVYLPDTTSVTGHPAPDPDPGFTLHPVPAGEILVVSSPELYRYSCYLVLDLSGRVLEKGAITSAGNDLQLSVEGLHSGFYLIQLRSREGAIRTGRFIKD